MLGTLRSLREFDSDANSIERAWREFIDVMAYRSTAEYHMCYSDAQIDAITRAAKEGVEGIGIVMATSQTKARVRDFLNDAWRIFWRVPADFPAWEVDEAGKLLPPAAA